MTAVRAAVVAKPLQAAEAEAATMAEVEAVAERPGMGTVLWG